MEGKNKEVPQVAVTLQRMSRDDFDAYIALEKQVESKTYAAAQNYEETAEEFAAGPMYLIKKGDAVVGAVSYSIKEDRSVYINGLTITPSFQGQGVGRQALEEILREAPVQAAPRVFLVVHPENGRAIALYRSFGFQETGRKENFHGDGEPRLVLTREQAAGER